MDPKYSEVERKLMVLQQVPHRNPLKAVSARKNFLKEIYQNQNVSFGEKSPHKSWKSMLGKKEAFPVKLAILITLIILIFGGSGATLAAAQTSLPDDLFYPVKLWTEDLQLEFVSNPDTSYQLMFKFASLRFEEIQMMIEASEIPPILTIYKWEYQWQRTIQLAMQTKEPQNNLLEVKEQLQQQSHFIYQSQNNTDSLKSFIYQFRDQIQQQLLLCELGTQDPQQMMLQIQNRLKNLKNFSKNGEYQWQYRYQNQEMVDTRTPEVTLENKMQNQNYYQSTMECLDCNHEQSQDQSQIRNKGSGPIPNEPEYPLRAPEPGV